MPKIAEIIIRKARKLKEKIDRSAFIYLDPSGPDTKNASERYQDYAQCGTCMMFTGEYLKKGERDGTCTILSPKEVDALGSCCLYVPGSNHPEMAGKEVPAVTKEEAGYVDRLVRCENCTYFDESKKGCYLFMKLNREHPDIFALDYLVHPKGCCNAQTPRY